MGVEIERKFLVLPGRRAAAVASGILKDVVEIEQGYLRGIGPETTVRVRVCRRPMSRPLAFLTIKGPTTGITRVEHEVGIKYPEATRLLKDCGNLVCKTRHTVDHSGVLWEIDTFEEPFSPLVVAEVELESEAQELVLPDWVGVEVSDDTRYFNSQLAVSQEYPEPLEPSS